MTSFIISSLALDCLSKSVPFKFDTAEGCGPVQKEHDLHLNKLVGGQGGKRLCQYFSHGKAYKHIVSHCNNWHYFISQT